MRFIGMIAVLSGLVLAQTVASQPRAEALYFTYLTKISSGQQQTFERFLNEVQPIWDRHEMTVLARARIVDAYGTLGDGFAPTEFGLLRAANRNAFNAYLSDPDYESIKELRTNSAEYFFVLESVGSAEDGPDFLKKTPLVALVLGTESKRREQANVALKINLAAAVKGTVPASLLTPGHLRFHAVSYDDNPTAFFSDSDPDAILLIGENLIKQR